MTFFAWGGQSCPGCGSDSLAVAWGQAMFIQWEHLVWFKSTDMFENQSPSNVRLSDISGYKNHQENSLKNEYLSCAPRDLVGSAGTPRMNLNSQPSWTILRSLSEARTLRSTDNVYNMQTYEPGKYNALYHLILTHCPASSPASWPMLPLSVH